MTDNIKLPLVATSDHPEFPVLAWSALELVEINRLMREAVRLNAQAVSDEPDWRHPKIQGLIGSEARLRIVIDLIWQILEDPNQEFTASDMEYWDTIHDKLKAALSAAPAAPQPTQPLDLSVMKLAESVGLIGPASRTDDLHGAIQRFHDLIVTNASIKAARHFADGLAQQPLTDEQIRSIGRQQDPMVSLHHEVLAFARAIEQAATAPLLARIAELEAELSAIGAGGVGPLMGKENSNAR